MSVVLRSAKHAIVDLIKRIDWIEMKNIVADKWRLATRLMLGANAPLCVLCVIFPPRPHTRRNILTIYMENWHRFAPLIHRPGDLFVFGEDGRWHAICHHGRASLHPSRTGGRLAFYHSTGILMAHVLIPQAMSVRLASAARCVDGGLTPAHL